MSEDHADLHGIAFAELVAYIEDFQMEEGVANWLTLHICTNYAWNNSELQLKAVFTHQD